MVAEPVACSSPDDPSDIIASLMQKRSTIVAFARKFVRDPDDVEDVAQEAMLTAWKALPGFRMEASLETWLYPIVQHCAERFLQRKQRYQKVLMAWAAEQEHAEASVLERAPESLLTEDEQRRALWILVDSLPSKYRDVLAWHYLYGWTCDNIATQMGISLNTVMTRLRRARNALRKCISERALDIDNFPLMPDADIPEWAKDRMVLNTHRLPSQIPLHGLDDDGSFYGRRVSIIALDDGWPFVE